MSFESYPRLNANLYTRPDHYAGETFEGTATLYGYHRDSDMLVVSNAHAIQSRLKGAVESGEVFLTHAGHWAVGWVTAIRVSPTASGEVLSECESILEELENYLILDESDLSEREFEAALEYWDGWTNSPESPDYAHRLRLIKQWNESRSPRKAVPFLAARHTLSALSEKYEQFEQWVQDCARE